MRKCEVLLLAKGGYVIRKRVMLKMIWNTEKIMNEIRLEYVLYLEEGSVFIGGSGKYEVLVLSVEAAGDMLLGKTVFLKIMIVLEFWDFCC